jgi:hypothetical protein
MRDLICVIVELRPGRKSTVGKEVGNLEERGLFGQLLDRVAPIAEDASFTVEKRDGALSLSRVGEASIEGDQAARIA